jgi:hypothetical protein
MVDGIKYIFAYERASHICDPANIKGLTKNAETGMVELLLVDDPHPVMEYSARSTQTPSKLFSPHPAFSLHLHVSLVAWIKF